MTSEVESLPIIIHKRRGKKKISITTFCFCVAFTHAYTYICRYTCICHLIEVYKIRNSFLFVCLLCLLASNFFGDAVQSNPRERQIRLIIMISFVLCARVCVCERVREAKNINSREHTNTFGIVAPHG